MLKGFMSEPFIVTGEDAERFESEMERVNRREFTPEEIAERERFREMRPAFEKMMRESRIEGYSDDDLLLEYEAILKEIERRGIAINNI